MRSSKKNRLTITIQRSVQDVFSFLIDPSKSPLWVDGFVEEKTSEWPVREGTVYRNLNQNGVWNEFMVTAIELNKLFILRAMDGNYHVRYTLKPLSDGKTELEYYEWTIRGILDQPFSQTSLEKLKNILETT